MRKAFFQLHFAILLAGLTGILGRLITLNEGLLVWYRLLISAATMWLLFFLQKKLKPVSAIEMLKLFGVGVVACLHWVAFYGSIKYSNVSVALVCFSAIGFFTALLEPLVMKTKIKITELLLGILTIAGIYLIFHFDPAYKTGIIVGLISSLLGCLFPILNRLLLRDHSAETVALYELSGGFVFLTLLLPFYLQVFFPDHLLPTTEDAIWLLVLSWACTVLAFTLSMKALQKINAFTVNLSYNLEPLYGIALAFAIFREDKSFGSEFYLGLSLIILSVVLQSFLVYKSGKSPSSIMRRSS